VQTTNLIVCLVTASGCATIVNGKTQDVHLASRPAGARVNVDGIRATTPATVTLPRKNSYGVVFSKEGFPDRQVKLTPTASVFLFGNIFFGGPIGLIVDLVTGAGYRLEPRSVEIDLASGAAKELDKE
jgi:hypothetical protein